MTRRLRLNRRRVLAGGLAVVGLVFLADVVAAAATGTNGGAPPSAFSTERFLAHWWVFPAAVAFSTVALAAGVSGALFFSPFFLLVVGLAPPQAIGAGLREGAKRAGVALVGGETAVMPDVIKGLDIAGTCAGLAPKDAVFPGEAEPGDEIVGWPSSGIHSNGLTLAREAVTRNHEYTDPFPPNPEQSIAEELLTPTRIYSEVLEPLRAAETHAAAHVTGGGWTNLTRMGDHHYEITDAFDPQSVFEFVQSEGNVADEEMHRTFNMGTGFVAALPEGEAVGVVDASEDARVIGYVEEGDGAVSVRGLTLN